MTEPMKEQVFRLYWPRETGIDSGTAIRANDLAPAVRDRVLALAGNEPGEFVVRLPFLDRKECRHVEIVRGWTLERVGNVIRAVLAPQAAARDLAATLALTDPLWRNAPSERGQAYFPVWQRVSLALQQLLRKRVAQAYFEDVKRFEDRPAAYPVIVYQTSRLCHGHPRTEFTYDLRDYPECRTTLEASWKMTGRAIQAVLRIIEGRLREAGMTELANRYAPVWHQDVLVAVKKQPKPYVGLLMAEASLINAVIDLGTERSVQAANRFAAVVNLNLRKIGGMDLRGLGTVLLEEATRVLERQSSRDHLIDAGILEDRDTVAARRPDAWIGGQENSHDGHAYCGGQVGDAGIVADEDARGRQPAGQFV
jgi:hypothetical protein